MGSCGEHGDGRTERSLSQGFRAEPSFPARVGRDHDGGTVQVGQRLKSCGHCIEIWSVPSSYTRVKREEGSKYRKRSSGFLADQIPNQF